VKLFSRLFAFIWSLARELSDEQAYARHLALTGRPASPAEWKSFTDCRYRRKYQNAKCC
jgi:hypothetical protein